MPLSAARDDDAGVDCAQIEQQPKIVQVAVVEGVLVVPFHFQRHAVLVAVDLVSRRTGCDVVHANWRIESLLGLPELEEFAVELVRDPRLSPAWAEDIASEKGEPAQHVEDVHPLLRMGCRQDRQAVAPLVHLVTLFDVGGDKGLIRPKAIVCAYSSQRQGPRTMFLICSQALSVPLSGRTYQICGKFRETGTPSTPPAPPPEPASWPTS